MPRYYLGVDGGGTNCRVRLADANLVTLADAGSGRSNLQIEAGEAAFRSISEGTRQVFEKAGIDFRITQPHKGFNRRIGEFGGHRIAPDGRLLNDAEWAAGRDQWLPNDSDNAFIHTLMKPSHRSGEYASWIAWKSSCGTTEVMASVSVGYE